MNSKFYVPKETVKMLKKAGYPDDTPTYHEVIDLFEKRNIYITTSITFDDDAERVHYSAECFIDDDDYVLDEYPSREEALNSAFIAVLENYEFDIEN